MVTMMLTHVDTIHHTFDFRCGHCYEHHTILAIHPNAGHVMVREDDLYITCPSCKARWEAQEACPECKLDQTKIHPAAVELIPFDHLSDVDTGDKMEPDSLVGTRLPGANGVENIVVLDDRRGRAHPARQHQARLILTLQRHPHVVAAREQARQSHDAHPAN